MSITTKPTFRDKVRLMKIAYAAMTDPDMSKVVVSKDLLRDLSLKQSFDAAAQYPVEMAKAKFLYYADTNHGDSRIHDFFYGQQNMDRMAEAGVKHIFPEIQPEYQSAIDGFVDGQLDFAEFADQVIQMQTDALPNKNDQDALDIINDPVYQESRRTKWRKLCEGFKRANDRGIKIHCLSDTKNTSEAGMHGVANVMHMVQRYMIEEFGEIRPIHGKIFFKAMQKNVAKIKAIERNMGDMKGFIEQRSLDDHPLAARMLAVAGDDKAATFFGVGHAGEKNGLFDALGQDKTLRVDLYGERDFYADLMFVPLRKGIQPHYIHIINEDRLFQVRKFG